MGLAGWLGGAGRLVGWGWQAGCCSQGAWLWLAGGLGWLAGFSWQAGWVVLAGWLVWAGRLVGLGWQSGWLSGRGLLRLVASPYSPHPA